MFRDEIIKALQKAIRSASSVQAGEKEIHLEFPEQDTHGDYSSNIAMQIAAKQKDKKTKKLKNKSPRGLAEEIVQLLQADKELMRFVDKIEVAGPGFINFWLSGEAMLSELQKVTQEKDKYGQSRALKEKKILLEHTSPNTIKTLHVGHIRNNILGMAVHNILEYVGANVKLDAINNDRGVHVMKAVWAYQKYGKGETPIKGDKTDQFVDKFYVRGAKEAEDKKVKEEVQELLRKWEAKDKEIRKVWKKLRDWTLAGFETTYKRLGSYHDHQWYESDFYREGKRIVEDGLKKKVFKKLPDGAVLSNLEKYSLSDAIILRADGTSMYHTQDLRLTQLKREKFPSDLYVWDIGPEQSLYLNQLFAMCEQLGIGRREDYMHLSYGFVFLKSGEKMSSRRGNVISANWLMDEMVKRAKKIIENSDTSRGLSKKEIDEVAEVVGIGAIKYGFSKPARETDIHFDMDESLSLEGNSGPYLQYTYARTQSVLAKARGKRQEVKGELELNSEETRVLRTLPRFTEIVEQSARNYAPNLLCNYLFDLAQKYNAFYARHRILDTNNERTKSKALSDNKHRILGSSNLKLRLKLTSATGQVLKNGLTLLGIATPERM